MFGPFFWGFAGFPTTPLLAVDVGAVQAPEIAQGYLWRTGLQDEVVPGNLSVIGEPGVAIFHPAEEEGVVLRESEDFPFGGTFGDRKRDLGGHEGVLPPALKTVNLTLGIKHFHLASPPVKNHPSPRLPPRLRCPTKVSNGILSGVMAVASSQLIWYQLSE